MNENEVIQDQQSGAEVIASGSGRRMAFGGVSPGAAASGERID